MNIKKIWIVVIGMVLSGCVMINDNEPVSEFQNEEGFEGVVKSNDTAVINNDIVISAETNQFTSLVEPTGDTVAERILCPVGFKRIEEDEYAFGSYLRNSLLKPHGTDVILFDGRAKGNQSIHAAVFDIDVGDRDLQQCADATMRLWAEYLRSIKQEDAIHFEFTNGFRVEYGKWMEGYRIKVDGNNVSWIKSREPSNSYDTFMSYMQIIYAYAGTLSLANELQSVLVDDMQIGDVFVQGGSPGHAVIVVDMAINNNTGERLFLLAQSFMPAQNIHILTNPNNELLSPWYVLDDRENFETPEWRFTKIDLKRYE